MPTKCIVDCSTGEQTYVEMPTEEVAEREAAAERPPARPAEEVAAEEARAAAKASADAKLKDLGLTEEEIAALTA